MNPITVIDRLSGVAVLLGGGGGVLVLAERRVVVVVVVVAGGQEDHVDVGELEVGHPQGLRQPPREPLVAGRAGHGAYDHHLGPNQQIGAAQLIEASLAAPRIVVKPDQE